MKTIELAKNLYCTKNEVFHSLVYENKSLCFFTFTKDVLNGKLHFLCSISYLDKGLLSFFGKVQHLWTFQACNFIKKETLAQLLYCKFCEISKNTLSYRTPLVAASNISLCVFQGPYLLSFIRIRRIIFYRNIQYDKIWLDLFSGSGKCHYTFLDVIIIWRILPETTELFQSGIGGQKLFRS